MKLRSLIDRRHAELGRALERPWLVDPAWLRDVEAAFHRGDHRRIEALVFGWGSAVHGVSIEGDVGVIEIRGPLLQGSVWRDYSDIEAALAQHLAEPGVRSILLDIDSPGGDAVPELYELAAAIRAAGVTKPVTALANGQATSAAYVIASGASKVYAAGRSAVLGSLGAIILHREQSGWLKKQGLGVTEIASGKHKTDLSPNKPLNADGRATLQAIVNVAFDELIEAVTAGRSISAAEIRAQEAAIYLAEGAIAAKLADGIRSRVDLVGELAQSTQSAGTGARAQASSGAKAKPAPADVIQLARAEGLDAAQERIHQINTYCYMAGCPERAGKYMSDPEMSAEKVRNVLCQEFIYDVAEEQFEIDAHPPVNGRFHPERTHISDAEVDAIYERWNADERGASLEARS